MQNRSILISLPATFEAVFGEVGCCPYQKSDPNIGMMESAEFKHRRDPAAVMNGRPNGVSLSKPRWVCQVL